MNLRRSCWTGICTALCLNGMVVLADETPVKVPLAEPVDVLVNVTNVQVEQDIEVVAQDPEVRKTEVRQILVGEGGEPGGLFLATEAGAAGTLAIQPDQSKYWVGLLCNTASDALKAQLDLESDVGLVVDEVTEGGPGSKAGIQRHDVLVKATTSKDGQTVVHKLNSLAELIACVQEAQAGTINVELVRRGKVQALAVVPAARPKTAVLNVHSVSPQHVIWETARMQPNSFGLRWAGPMIVQYGPSGTPVGLPEGMTIELSKAEDGTEKVTVKQGDQTWQAELKALDKLPTKVGDHVRSYMASRRELPANAAWAYSSRSVGGVMAYAQAALPDDVKVTVVRKGADPAKVTIQKGGTSWEGTEKDLENCPKELKPIAEMALAGHGALRVSSRPVTPPNVAPAPNAVRYLPPGNAQQFTVPIAPPVMVPSPARQNDIERQLKELSDQVEKLRQAVEKSQPKQ